MNRLIRRTGYGAAALLGLSLIMGTVSAQAADPSVASFPASNRQPAAQHQSTPLDVDHVVAFQRRAADNSDISNDERGLLNRGDTQHPNGHSTDDPSSSASVIKYQSPYMSAPY